MRRQFIVKKEMQLKLIFTIVLLFFLIFVISFGNIYILLNYFITQLKMENPDIQKSVSLIIASLKWRLLLIIFVNLIVIILIGIIFTHQIAGPSFNIERVLSKMADGDLSLKVKLRKTDQLTNLEEKLNHFLEVHREKLKDIKSSVLELDKILAEGKIEEGKKLMKKLKGKFSQIKLEEEEKGGNEANG